MARSGWVMLPMDAVEDDPVSEWIEESYRNVAPKKLAAQLGAG